MSALAAARPLIDRRLPRLAMTYRFVRDLWQSLAPSVQTPLGFSFIGSTSMQNGTFEATEVRIVQQLLKQCDVFINIGANAGYYCCIAAQAGKSVIAFEPLPENVRLLLRNVHDNQFGALVEIFPIGLGAEATVAKLYGGGTGASLNEGWAGSSEGYSRLVPVSSADLVLGDRLVGRRCLIVMDIEGAELPALRGSQLLLSQVPKPTWMVEIVGKGNQSRMTECNSSFEGTFELFWSHGYEAWTAEIEPRPIGRDDVVAMNSAQSSTSRVHNYLFVDRLARPMLFSNLVAGQDQFSV